MDWAAVSSCAAGAEGNLLHKLAGDQTHALKPRVGLFITIYQYCHNHIEGASLTLLRFRPSTERGTESNQHYSNVFSPMSPLLTLDQSPMFGVCVAPGRGGRIFI